MMNLETKKRISTSEDVSDRQKYRLKSVQDQEPLIIKTELKENFI